MVDHPPREMKETLFTRHSRTVLPLVGITKKEIHPRLFTHHLSIQQLYVDSMTDHSLLNKRPPLINSEETFLSRRQQANLSKLRSGHGKLLNSYKKRLKQTDSSNCPDCGMDPQDVPHLFNCTDHPYNNNNNNNICLKSNIQTSSVD